MRQLNIKAHSWYYCTTTICLRLGVDNGGVTSLRMPNEGSAKSDIQVLNCSLGKGGTRAAFIELSSQILNILGAVFETENNPFYL